MTVVAQRLTVRRRCSRSSCLTSANSVRISMRNWRTSPARSSVQRVRPGSVIREILPRTMPGNRAGCVSEGRVEQPEPARQILLDRQFRLKLRLQLHLLGVVPLLALAGRDERPEGALLEAVDPVRTALLELALEREDGGEQLAAEAAVLELLRDQMRGRDEVLEVLVVDDEPLEAHLVALALDLRARLARDGVQQLLELVLCAHELTGRERLEADARRSRRLQVELGLERYPRRRDREQPLLRGILELLAPEEDVAETQAVTRPAGPSPGRSSRELPAASRAAGGP